MAQDRMAVLEMLCKATSEGDVDVLREGPCAGRGDHGDRGQ